MRVGICQVNMRTPDLDERFARIESYASMAARRGAELVAFPLNCLSELGRESLLQDVELRRELSRGLVGLSDRLPCPCLLPVSLPPSADGDGIQLLLIGAGKAEALVDVGATREGPIVFEFAGRKVASAFSEEDLDYLGGRGTGLDLVFYFSSKPYARGDVSSVLSAGLGESRFALDARAAVAPLCLVGPIGGSGQKVYAGGSGILDAHGRLLASCPSFEESLACCEIGPAAADAPGPLSVAPLRRSQLLWQALALGLRDHMARQDQGREVVLPLDERLSSRLALVLATDALGPGNVHALLAAPDETGTHALRAFAQSLSVDCRTAWSTSALALRLGRRIRPQDVLGQGMVQAQLASWADELGAQVLSCVDKTSLCLGEDEGVPLSACLAPLGDVYRSELPALARQRNTVSPVFPSTDPGEGDLPLPLGLGIAGSPGERLELIDAILRERVTNALARAEIALSLGCDDALVDLVVGAMRRPGASAQLRVPVIDVSGSAVAEWCARRARTWRFSHEASLAAQGVEKAAHIEAALGKRADKANPGGGRGVSQTSGIDPDELREALEFLGDLIQGGTLMSPEAIAPEPPQDLEGPQGGLPIWPASFSEN